MFVKRFCSVTFQHIPTNPSGETAKEIIVVETLPPESVFEARELRLAFPSCRGR